MKKKPIIILSAVLITAMIFYAGVSNIISGATSKYNYVDAFSKSLLYYEASWCGSDAGENNLPWRGPCHTEDGQDLGIDLTGGFHDAGDHVKFGLPQVYAASTLGWSYYEFKDTYKSAGKDKEMLKILKHFTDYFLKCYTDKTTFHYQCGDGITDHSYWGPPELQKTSRPTQYTATKEEPASDICGSAAASLALMYINYKDIDSSYAEKCLSNAKDLYEFAKTYKGLGKSGGFYDASGYWDDLCWGAVWLNIATGDEQYMSDIEDFMVAKEITDENGYLNHWTHCWDDVYGGVFVKLAQISDRELYKKVAEENLSYWMDGIPTTKAGLTYLNSWGVLRYTAAECMLAVVYYKSSKDEKYLDFAKSQIDYMLGDNPRNSSYVVGFGENYPKFPHHRAASGRFECPPANEKKTEPQRHLLYGALVGGPTLEDTYTDDVDQYVHTEVSIDYNAGFVGAMAGMSEFLGEGQKPEETPGIESNENPEFYVDAKVYEEDAKHTTISSHIHNESLLPPRYEKGLSFRYFVDLTEFYEEGLTVDDVMIELNYGASGGKMSKLQPWNEAAHIYYIEASWDDVELYGNAEFQFAMAQYDYEIWDPSNDYSNVGLSKDGYVVTKRMPVYKNGVKIFGEEPSKTDTPAPKPTATAVNGSDTTSGTNNSVQCSVLYKVKESWEGGAVLDITIQNNGTTDISGWNLLFDFPGDQIIDDSWNVAIAQNGKSVSAKNQSWTTKIPVNGSVSFGVNVSCTSNEIPSEFTLNGVKCKIEN